VRVAVVLLGYAVFLGAGATWWLPRSAWVERAPRLGVLAWQVATVGLVVSVALAGLAVAAPSSKLSGDLADLLQACVMALRAQYATPGGVAVSASGAILVLGILGRIGYCLVATFRAAGRGRRAHLQTLTLIGRTDASTDAVILAHGQPAAYCLPGRRGRIVLTSAALDRLGADELRAVLAHERSHLRARHDLAVAAATALTRAFPKVPVLRVARDQIARLAELAADDAACRAVGRLPMAEALLTVAGSKTPAPALAVGGSHTGGRIRRLLKPAAPLGRVRTASALLLSASALVLPLVVAAEPALAAQHLNYCPVAAAPPAHG
jgi:Zn-dependent protease with chaperone function